MNCSFCGDTVVPGTGKMYVKRDGTVLHFCKAKCQRNMVGMGRINRNVGWTQAYAEHKGDRMTANAAIAAHAGKKEAAKAPKAKAAPKSETKAA